MIEPCIIEKFALLSGKLIALDREEIAFLYRKFSYLAGKEPQDSQRFSYYVGIADSLRTILKLFNTR